MAVTPCPECQKPVSSGATECPSCGVHLRWSWAEKGGFFITLAVVGLAIYGIIELIRR